MMARHYRLLTELLAGQSTWAESGVEINDSLRLGLMLPYTGTYAALGEAITNGLALAIDENGGRLGGRAVETLELDSEANPAKTPQNMSRLVKGEGVPSHPIQNVYLREIRDGQHAVVGIAHEAPDSECRM